MRHMEMFEGRIGRIDELHELGDNNCVLNFSVAETPRIKKNGEWVDDVTIWTDVSLFGDVARNFVKSDIKPGTFVLVYGRRKAREYTTKDTQEKRVVQSITAEAVAVSITRWDYIEKMGNVSSNKGVSQAAPQSQAAPAQQAAPAAQADPFAGTQQPTASADPFGMDNDPFGGGDSSPFGDDSNPFGI